MAQFIDLTRMEEAMEKQIERIVLKSESDTPLEFAEMQVLKQAIIDEQSRIAHEKWQAEQEASKEQREESRGALTQAITAMMASIQ